MQDSAHILQQQVQQAFADQQALCIRGGNSKRFYGYAVTGEVLNTTVHSGIIEYEPTELILRARAGTPLKEIEAALEKNRQMLACEPPYFSDTATIGGAVAAGLSGPSRPFRAALQDTVLGCGILNGRGESLSFGGKVMKNVAGYDLSRLMTGAMGCLGVILDVTVKIIPATLAQASYVFSISPDKSVAFINDLRKQGLPVTATCQIQNDLMVRFSAGSNEISGIAKQLAKQYSFIEWQACEDETIWEQLREQTHSFFNQERAIWRLSVPADADIGPLVHNPEDLITEWGGCLHWLKSDTRPDELFSYLASINGHATLFKRAPKKHSSTVSRHTESGLPENIFQPLAPALAQWHKRLKDSFDPAGILNPGKMYQEF